MTLLNIIIIAVALGVDAFAVSIAVGIKLKQLHFRQVFRLSWHFGLFQAMMPIIGWGTGYTIFPYVEAYGHWVAFILLFLVGGNMIREALGPDDGEALAADPTRGVSLMLLSVATSLDALAVGFSLSMLKASILFPALVIGIIAGSMTIAGMHIGRKLGSIPSISLWAEILGGVVLWGIGINILHESGVFGFL